jgi:hypothetical protein
MKLFDKDSFLSNFNLNTIIKLLIMAVLSMTVVVLYSLNNKLNKEDVLDVNPIKIELQHHENPMIGQ